MAAHPEAATSGSALVPLVAPEADADDFQRRLNEFTSMADEAEVIVKKAVQFYACHKKSLVGAKDKSSIVSKRMQDLMRQVGTMLRQISAHPFAKPFLHPVDVKGLGLTDYYEIIERPMDLGTIQHRMEAKDESRYRNVWQIYSDVKLVFSNAMKYNPEEHEVHIVAKQLLEKFEEKWRQLLPKISEEEDRQKAEAVNANMAIAGELEMSKLFTDAENKLNELDSGLIDLRDHVIHRFGKMSTEDKRKLGTALCRVSVEDLNKALEIVAQENPNFQFTSEEVDLDMDAQSESTLWRLKFFVRDALEKQAKTGGKVKEKEKEKEEDETSKRKLDCCDEYKPTPAKKRCKKPLS